MKDKNYLINMYNATSTDDGSGEIETYEVWLERQLLSRINKISTIRYLTSEILEIINGTKNMGEKERTLRKNLKNEK